MKTRQLARGSQFEPRHIRKVVAPDDGGDPIGMTGNDMAAEFVADLQARVRG